MILIKNDQELNDWLKEYNYFEDGHVLKLEKDPFALTIGILTSGNYEAYTNKEILCFKIVPKNIFSCEYPPDFKPSDDHYIEAIESLEVSRGVGLQVFGPPTLTVKAETFIISDREIIKSTFKPWLNPKHIWIKFPMKEIPKPNFWKEKFKDQGHDIIFRFYSGESKPSQLLPYPNYSGYFFQLEDRLGISKEGILIDNCAIKDCEVFMGFRKCDEGLDLIWKALATILSDIPDIKISCGNCKFTGEEWKRNIVIDSNKKGQGWN